MSMCRQRKRNEQTQSAFEIEIKTNYADFDPILIAQKVAKKTIKKLNADSLASKVYPVVFEREAMANLLGVFTSFFSGEAAVKKLTPLLGKEGEKVFSELLTIVDEAIYPESPYNEPFDDEALLATGRRARNVAFKTFLHNPAHFKQNRQGTVSSGRRHRRRRKLARPGERTLKSFWRNRRRRLITTAGLHAANRHGD